MIKCFLCDKDITNGVKVLSYFNFPDKAWDLATKNWVKDFRELFNGVMCQECARKDLEVAHAKTKKKEEPKKIVPIKPKWCPLWLYAKSEKIRKALGNKEKWSEVKFKKIIVVE